MKTQVVLSRSLTRRAVAALCACCAGLLALPEAAPALSGSGTGGDSECVRFKAGREVKSGDCSWSLGITGEYSVEFSDEYDPTIPPEEREKRPFGMDYRCVPNRAGLPDAEAHKLPKCKPLVHPLADAGEKHCAETDVMPGERCAFTLDGRPAALPENPPKPGTDWFCLEKTGTDEVMCMKRDMSGGDEAGSMSDDEFIELCASYSPDAVRRALKDGANPNAANVYGVTALMKAASFGDAETVRVLLSAKADVNARDKEGATALMGMMTSAQTAADDPDVARLLISAGADVNAARDDGMTALMLAAWRSRTEMAALLLSSGANRSLEDKKGRDALWHARHPMHEADEELIRLLEDGGAKKPAARKKR